MSAIDNLDQIMNGAVTERYEAAMKQVIENILDINTQATKERKITLTISVKPNEKRDVAEFKVETRTTLVPRMPVTTTLMFGADDNGTIVAREHRPNIIPGQMDIYGQEIGGKTVPLTKIK